MSRLCEETMTFYNNARNDRNAGGVFRSMCSSSLGVCTARVQLLLYITFSHSEL